MQNKQSIDYVVHLISITLCNPLLATLVPLTMLTSTTLTTSSIQFRLSLLYSVLLWSYRVLWQINRRLRLGRPSSPPPEKGMEWGDQVVVVTGASSGLGRALTALFSIRRCGAVYNLDTVPPADPDPITTYIPCDVTDSSSLDAAVQSILTRHATVSIVISNAGVMKMGSIQAQSMTDVDAVMAVCLRAQFLLSKALVPALTRDAAWVTVGSTLGHVGVFGLSAYCVAKAGAMAFHESLTVELARSRPDVGTFLVLPGKLGTDMFRHVRTPSEFLAPTVDVLELAKDIVAKIERREAGEYAYPLYAGYLGLLRVLPSGLVQVLRRLSGIDRAIVDTLQRKSQSGCRE